MPDYACYNDILAFTSAEFKRCIGFRFAWMGSNIPAQANPIAFSFRSAKRFSR